MAALGGRRAVALFVWPQSGCQGKPGDITVEYSVWFLVGNGGMDPYDNPLRVPNSSPYNPFLHSLLGTRQYLSRKP